MSYTIILPTDFSENAQNACDYALQLFRNSETHFVLVNAFGTTHSKSGMIKSLDEILSRESESDLYKEQMRLKTLTNSNSHSFEHHPFEGTINDAIDHFEEVHKGFDLTVMGTKGATGLKQVLLGSNTVDVINHTTNSVLAVPDNYKYKKIENILVLKDPMRGYSAKSFELLANLVKLSSGQVHMLTVNCPEDVCAKFQADVHNWYPELNIKFYTTESKNIEEAVDEYSKKIKADLVTVFPRKSNFFSRILQKNLTTQIAYHSEVPLLAIKE